MVQLQRYTHEDYSIGWVCALPNEQSAAFFMLDERHEDLDNPPNDQNAYTLGSIGKHKVVIAGLPKGRYGNNSSATVATRMISTFRNIRVGLMVGIGGGIPQKTRLGDVVISCPSGTEPGVVQWDMGKAEQGGQFKRTGSLAPPPTSLLTALGKFEADQITTRKNMLSYLEGLRNIPGIKRSFLKSDSLTDVLFDSKYAHVIGEDCSQCDEKMLTKREAREDDMVIHCGLIASGNQVIKDAILRDKLFEQFDKNVLCVEMEAAGLMNDFPCIVIRGICDYADSHKNKAWQNYAATVAAACAKAFLAVVPASEVDKLQRVQVSISPNAIQGAKKFVEGWWGGKQSTVAEPSVTSSPSEAEDNKQDDIPLSPTSEATPEATFEGTTEATSEVTPSTDTSLVSSHLESTEVHSKTTPGEVTLTHDATMQASLELLVREAPALLAKMAQEPQVDAALKVLIKNLTKPQIPQEGMNTLQNTNWNNYPQTPPMSPQANTWPAGENNGYSQGYRGFGSSDGSYISSQPPRSQAETPSVNNGYQDIPGLASRSDSYAPGQPWPAYHGRDGSSSTRYSRGEVGNLPFNRSQTYPSDPRSNQSPVHQAPEYANYRNNVYDADRRLLRTDHDQELPPRPPKIQDNSARGRNFEDSRGLEQNVRINAPRYDSDNRAAGNRFTIANRRAANLSELRRHRVDSELLADSDANQRQRIGNSGQSRGDSATNRNSSHMSPERVRELLSEGLFSQIKKGSAAAVKRLLESGADIESVDGDGFTPLWRAVQIGRRDVIQALLDNRANVDALNSRGQNVLAWALEHGQDEIVNMLVT